MTKEEFVQEASLRIVGKVMDGYSSSFIVNIAVNLADSIEKSGYGFDKENKIVDSIEKSGYGFDKENKIVDFND